MAIVKLNPLYHGNLKFKREIDLEVASKQHLVPIPVQEFTAAALELPIVFIKLSDGDALTPIVMMGLESGENLLIKDGVWQSFYVPSALAAHPVRLVQAADTISEPEIAYDDIGTRINETEGEAFYNADGSESEFTINLRKALMTHIENNQVTKGFVQLLLDLDLLSETTIDLMLHGKKSQIAGIFVINENRFNSLSDDQFKDLRTRGMLTPIYAQMMSLSQMQRLSKIKSELEA